MSSAGSSSQAFPACCSQHSAGHDKSFAHEAFLRRPWNCDRWTPKHVMRQDASIKDVASWLDSWLQQSAIASQVQRWPCITCGNQIRTHSVVTHQKHHSLRDVTAQVPHPCGQDFVHGLSQSCLHSSFQPLISVMTANAAKTVLFENSSVGDDL